MAHVGALDRAPAQRFAHHLGGQFGWRNVFQAATKCANSGAHTADYYYFTCHDPAPVSVSEPVFEWNMPGVMPAGQYAP